MILVSVLELSQEKRKKLSLTQFRILISIIIQFNIFSFNLFDVTVRSLYISNQLTLFVNVINRAVKRLFVCIIKVCVYKIDICVLLILYL